MSLRISGRHKVDIVGNAIRQVIQSKFNRRLTLDIPLGGLMEKSCLELVELAAETDTTLRELVEYIVGGFSPEFCKKTFRTPYPQPNVILSQKSIAKIRVQIKKPVRAEKKDLSRIVAEYMDVMRDVDREAALACVRGGWPEGPQMVRTALENALKGRR